MPSKHVRKCVYVTHMSFIQHTRTEKLSKSQIPCLYLYRVRFLKNVGSLSDILFKTDYLLDKESKFSGRRELVLNGVASLPIIMPWATARSPDLL